jgi:predicted signal transduction protein with EAL and GGDEF domain
LFTDHLELALAKCSRTGDPVAVAFADLDDCKLVNDTYGHSAGDQLLAEVAHRLRAALRPGDTVARFGGDEFVILCDGVGDDLALAKVLERMQINVSGRQLVDPGLLAALDAAFEQCTSDDCRLEIEITESVLLADLPTVRALLLAMRRRGASIALDDFGTGYSSLTSLQQLPVDTVKLDRSFVSQLSTPGGNAAIVKAIVELAHALDLRVVGEGVESARQLEVLTDLGCDAAQGFHLGRPVPAAELTAVIRSGSVA